MASDQTVLTEKQLWTRADTLKNLLDLEPKDIIVFVMAKNDNDPPEEEEAYMNLSSRMLTRTFINTYQ